MCSSYKHLRKFTAFSVVILFCGFPQLGSCDCECSTVSFYPEQTGRSPSKTKDQDLERRGNKQKFDFLSVLTNDPWGSGDDQMERRLIWRNTKCQVLVIVRSQFCQLSQDQVRQVLDQLSHNQIYSSRTPHTSLAKPSPRLNNNS